MNFNMYVMVIKPLRICVRYGRQAIIIAMRKRSVPSKVVRILRMHSQFVVDKEILYLWARSWCDMGRRRLLTLVNP